MSITLILGGARSGKSKRAETLAKQSGKPVCYVATAPMMKDDTEWQARIQKHQAQRPSDWLVIEEPLSLCELLGNRENQEKLLLIDCLTLWLSNTMFAKKDVELERNKLCKALKAYAGEVILVSNEVGCGLVPESPLGRAFRDEQGRLNQAVAKVADHAEFVVAGLPLKLK